MISKPSFAPISGVDATDDELEAFAARKGIPSMQPPAPNAPEAAKIISFGDTDKDSQLLPKAPPEVLQGRMTLELPVYLIDILRLSAAKSKCSVRHLVMKALLENGYEINTEDLVSDRRRTSVSS